MNKSITAYAPASIGNVSLGFDLLGAALTPIDGSPLGDQVDVSSADTFSLKVEGRFADKLPADPKSNIVFDCYTLFTEKLRERGLPTAEVAMVLRKNLPIGSGLGSSASSIVAALHGLNQFFDEPFDANELLLLMGELEGQISGSVHYDNVAPCFVGGLTLMNSQSDQIALSLPVFENWYWVVCYSGISVSTAAARDILPKQIAMAETITFGQQLAVFVDASYRKDEALAAAVMKDVLAEPYRKSLLPKFDESRDFVMSNGGLAFGISGSGPTVFAVCNNLEQAQGIQHWLSENYIQNDTGFSHICQIDTQGAVVS
ncbi:MULTISPECIES: homoserine kinase [Aliiglaciecola]|uniref:homoserine kinase n=1 Tax=Aliiglaciecola TaxID=1406885 RepID=UPI001C097AF7|nr:MULTISPECIES: homoserine kinase [Aliiglaciecola]MBU2876603.1 homoserine kinase [Aliiglaciecola lipolytica]MDO6711462.1 homoserine kinase [Aliiglaciecola sp. 2_MG-2023]MDO6752561.1 homoserine kinase [Aliiglaciecola sp. 1_MG-2023]